MAADEVMKSLVVNELTLGKLGTIRGEFSSIGTANVSITNVGADAISTATIAKWFQIKDKDGNVYYIPCWI